MAQKKVFQTVRRITTNTKFRYVQHLQTHFSGDEFTESELNEIRQYRRIVNEQKKIDTFTRAGVSYEYI